LLDHDLIDRFYFFLHLFDQAKIEKNQLCFFLFTKIPFVLRKISDEVFLTFFFLQKGMNYQASHMNTLK
jgi:hypothetical protein